MNELERTRTQPLHCWLPKVLQPKLRMQQAKGRDEALVKLLLLNQLLSLLVNGKVPSVAYLVAFLFYRIIFNLHTVIDDVEDDSNNKKSKQTTTSAPAVMAAAAAAPRVNRFAADAARNAFAGGIRKSSQY